MVKIISRHVQLIAQKEAKKIAPQELPEVTCVPETPLKASEWEEEQWEVFPATPQKPHRRTIAFDHLDSE